MSWIDEETSDMLN